VLVGGGLILAVFALIAFWPADEAGSDGNADKTAAAGEQGPDGGRAGAGKGGVQARDYDEPSAPTRQGKRNPAVRLPNVGMSPEAPAPQDDTPPVFASKAEEIAWYEHKLEKAKELRDARQKFTERLPKVKEKIESSPNADQQMQAFEKRKKIVEDNYEKAQADVDALEKKLEELRRG
jgi:ribosomal protein L15